jgi:hypothetical protein
MQSALVLPAVAALAAGVFATTAVAGEHRVVTLELPRSGAIILDGREVPARTLPARLRKAAEGATYLCVMREPKPLDGKPAWDVNDPQSMRRFKAVLKTEADIAETGLKMGLPVFYNRDPQCRSGDEAAQ